MGTTTDPNAAAAAAQAVNGNGSKALARRDPAQGFIEMLERAKGELQRAATRHLDVERMSRLAITVVRKNPTLLECTPVSFIASVMQATQLGLELDGVLGRAYLVPFNNGKTGRKECQLIVGYKGMIELALRSGMVETVEANVVYQGDDFEYEEGLERRLRHIPRWETDDPAKITHAYAIVRLKGGGVLFKALPRVYIERVRAKSPGSGRPDSPWNTNTAAMYMKTPIRWIFKFTPASSEVARAVGLEERLEAGISQHDDDILDFSQPSEETDGGDASAEPPPKAKTTSDLKARAKAEKEQRQLVVKREDGSVIKIPCEACGLTEGHKMNCPLDPALDPALVP